MDQIIGGDIDSFFREVAELIVDGKSIRVFSNDYRYCTGFDLTLENVIKSPGEVWIANSLPDLITLMSADLK